MDPISAVKKTNTKTKNKKRKAFANTLRTRALVIAKITKNKTQAVVDADLPGWVSVGFSSNGEMVGSDAVVGFPTQGTAIEYDLDSKVRRGCYYTLRHNYCWARALRYHQWSRVKQTKKCCGWKNQISEAPVKQKGRRNAPLVSAREVTLRSSPEETWSRVKL